MERLTMTTNNNASDGLLDRILNADPSQPLSAETSRYLLSLRFPTQDVERTNELLAKNRQGQISKAERDELDHLVDVNYLIAALQSRARMALKKGA
jgi:hypothetical protein